MKLQNKIAKILKNSKKIAFFHHNNPDGDAIGSSYALLKVIEAQFPDKELAYLGDYDYLVSNFPFIDFDKKVFEKEISGNWTVVVGDTSTKSRIYNFEQYLKGDTKICFDHHLTDSDLETDIMWKDDTFDASSVQSWMIAKILNKNIDSKTALLFLIGIITDTGWFAYSLNNTRPLNTAVNILEKVARKDVDELYQQMRKKTKKSILLQKWVLNNYKFVDKFVYCIFREKDLDELKIVPSECQNIWQIGNIEGSNVWAFFVEDKKNNALKISLRSTGKNVGSFAKQYGGGGHERAAGIKVELNEQKLQEIIKKLIIYAK